jgi:hypothetical protein
MGEATRRGLMPTGCPRARGRDVVRRAEGLRAAALDMLERYQELAGRYERLLASVDGFWDNVNGADRVPFEVNDLRDLHAALRALDGIAERFEDAGLASFASAVHDAFGAQDLPHEEAALGGAPTPLRRRATLGQH